MGSLVELGEPGTITFTPHKHFPTRSGLTFQDSDFLHPHQIEPEAFGLEQHFGGRRDFVKVEQQERQSDLAKASTATTSG